MEVCELDVLCLRTGGSYEILPCRSWIIFIWFCIQQLILLFPLFLVLRLWDFIVCSSSTNFLPCFLFPCISLLSASNTLLSDFRDFASTVFLLAYGWTTCGAACALVSAHSLLPLITTGNHCHVSVWLKLHNLVSKLFSYGLNSPQPSLPSLSDLIPICQPHWGVKMLVLQNPSGKRAAKKTHKWWMCVWWRVVKISIAKLASRLACFWSEVSKLKTELIEVSCEDPILPLSEKDEDIDSVTSSLPAECSAALAEKIVFIS